VNDMLRAEVVCGERGAAAVAVINFTLDGVPLLYNGQEIGDTAPQSIYAPWPVGWAAACLPKPKAKYEFHQRLCQLRRDEAVLGKGDVIWLDNDQPDAVVSFLRRSEEMEILTVANFSNRKISAGVRLPEKRDAAFKPLLAGMAKTGTADGGASFEFGPFGYFVGKRSAK